jgi:hypothetical protein
MSYELSLGTLCQGLTACDEGKENKSSCSICWQQQSAHAKSKHAQDALQSKLEARIFVKRLNTVMYKDYNIWQLRYIQYNHIQTHNDTRKYRTEN